MLKHRSPTAQNGVTLIELMIVVVITAILMALAVPAFIDTIDRNRLKSVAEVMLSDLEYMKLESVKRNKPVFLSMRNDSPSTGDWCYGLRESSNCNCKSTSCTIDGTSKVTSYTDYKGIKITAPTTTSPTPFDFSVEQIRGQITLSAALTNNRIRLTSEKGREVDIQVSTTGRFFICSPSGSTTVFGYPTC